MLRICFWIAFLFLFSGGAISSEIKNHDLTKLPVCNALNEHYQQIFNGIEDNTDFDFSNPELKYIPWIEKEELGKDKGHYMDHYSLESLVINADGGLKRIVDFTRWFNWKGKITTLFVVNEEDYENFKRDLDDLNRINLSDQLMRLKILPLEDRKYDWYWGKDRALFKYKNQLHLVLDDKKLESNKEVYKFNRDMSLNKVCEIDVYKANTRPERASKLKVLNKHVVSTMNMMRSRGHCGQNRPENYASQSFNEAIKKAIYRPWILAGQKWAYERTEDFQRIHFDHWAYQDIWTKREKDTYKEILKDAEHELAEYYRDAFSYSNEKSRALAIKVLDVLPSYYYSLGYYQPKFDDISVYLDMAGGTFNNWKDLPQLIESSQFSWGFFDSDLSRLSLFVDHPSQLLNLGNTFDVNASLTKYNKTLLMYAAHMDNYESVVWLTKNAANINAVTKAEHDYCKSILIKRDNRSALTYAVENASIYVIKHLVESGADLSILDSEKNNLDFYFRKNPRFTEEERKQGLIAVLKKYSDLKEPSPSFKCAEGLNKIERAICDSHTLSIYDQQLVSEYKSTRVTSDTPETLKSSQISWIKSRNKKCGKMQTDDSLKSCLAQSYRSRLRYLYFLQEKEGDRFQSEKH